MYYCLNSQLKQYKTMEAARVLGFYERFKECADKIVQCTDKCGHISYINNITLIRLKKCSIFISFLISRFCLFVSKTKVVDPTISDQSHRSST